MFKVKDVGLDKFQGDMEYVIKNMPKQTRQLLQRTGTRARAIFARRARSSVEKKTGNYFERFKRGKVWAPPDSKAGTLRVRVYNNSPHAHLIEDGHRIVGKDGSEHGFQPGLKVMDKGNREVEKEWDDILEKEFDKILSKL